MLAARILHHIEAVAAIFDAVAELEDLELILGRFVLLFSQVSVDLFHVLGCMLGSHILRNLLRLELLHHCRHTWEGLDVGQRRIEATHVL